MMVSTLVFTFLALLALVSGQVTVTDFEDSIAQFEFIYHENHHLLLVIHNDSCYFVSVREGLELWRLDPINRQHIETRLKVLISYHDPRYIARTSLEVVRDTYQDLLADFHCRDKNLYIIIE